MGSPAVSAYALTIFCLLTSTTAANGVIGMNWGRQSAQRLVPSMVVDILLQNGVPKARIFTSQVDMLMAFSGSGIVLNLGIFNTQLITEEIHARDWVQKVLPYLDSANVSQVYIGEYIYEGSNQDNNGTSHFPYIESILNVMKLVQDALNKVDKGDHVNTNIALSFGILKDNITKPSEAEIHDDFIPYFKQVLDHVIAYNAPLVIQIYPMFYIAKTNTNLDFAFIGGSNHVVVDDAIGAVYNNLFEFMYDSFVWAMEKAGAPSGIEVIVSNIGWPTDGYQGANSSSAERFYKGFLPYIASGKGTPKRPGRAIEVYLQSLTDEPLNSPEDPYFRHWGIYRSNGEPKYKIDLSGMGRDIFPAQARGIQRMPERWCVFNEDMSNLKLVYQQIDVACKGGDCTATTPGGSCSELNFKQNVSYSFNMFFQTTFQNETMCDFGGLGKLVPDDPSVGTCVFPVEVVKGRQVNKVYGNSSSADRGRWSLHGTMMLFVILVSVILVL